MNAAGSMTAFYHVQDWNLSHLILSNSIVELVNRTNNPIERFNKEIKSHFTSPNPIMNTFVKVIKEISLKYVERLENVRNGHADIIERPPAYIPNLPDGYDLFGRKKKAGRPGKK